jgi:nucleoside-diphosphate-sugar epimerase
MAGEDDGGRLVLGATSLIGRFLAPRLADAARPPIALSRNPGPMIADVRWMVGDLEQPESLRDLGVVSEVFSLAPIWTLTTALPVLHDHGMRRLVAFSSTSRFSKQESTSPSERATAGALAEGETGVTAFCAAHGIGYTLLRPTLIYAEGRDGNVSRLAGLIRRFGVLPLPNGQGGRRQPVHAEDLANVALTAMARPASDRAYDLPGGETLSYRAMVERIFEGLDRRPRIVAIPPGLMRLGYALGRPWLPGSTMEMVDRIGEDLTFDGEAARRDLGWAPRDFHPRF